MRILIGAIAVLLATSHAFGDAKSEADRLFDEGVALRDAGKLEAACAKFAEAMKKDERAIGTLLNLALCAEREGRVATAVKLFSEARDRSKEQDMAEQQKAAEEHIATLSPMVPQLVLVIAETQPNMKLLYDNEVIALPSGAPGSRAELRSAIDPGTHTISVSAPGFLSWESTITIEKSKTHDLAVPRLEKSIVVKSSKATIGKITTITGGAIFLASCGLALVAKSKYDAAFEDGSCADGTCSNAGQKETDRARTYGTVATIVGGVGLAAAGVGLYLWLTAPSGTQPTERSQRDAARSATLVTPIVTPDHVGFATTLHW